MSMEAAGRSEGGEANGAVCSGGSESSGDQGR